MNQWTKQIKKHVFFFQNDRGLRSRSLPISVSWKTSTRSWRLCKLSALSPELQGSPILSYQNMVWNGHTMGLGTGLDIRMFIYYIYVSILIWRPDAQTEILKLCADCTKSDVALNNLVIRARPISWLKHTTHVYMWLPPTQFLHLPCHLRRRQIKAPAAAKAKSSTKPSKPGQVTIPKKAKPAKAKRSAKPTTKEE